MGPVCVDARKVDATFAYKNALRAGDPCAPQKPDIDNRLRGAPKLERFSAGLPLSQRAQDILELRFIDLIGGILGGEPFAFALVALRVILS